MLTKNSVQDEICVDATLQIDICVGIKDCSSRKWAMVLKGRSKRGDVANEE